MSPFDRAMQAVSALAPEDIALLFHDAVLDRIALEQWPALLFNGRSVNDVEQMVLWLWLGLPADAQLPMLWALLEEAVDRVPSEPLRRMAHWIEASLGSGRV